MPGAAERRRATVLSGQGVRRVCMMRNGFRGARDAQSKGSCLCARARAVAILVRAACDCWTWNAQSAVRLSVHARMYQQSCSKNHGWCGERYYHWIQPHMGMILCFTLKVRFINSRTLHPCGCAVRGQRGARATRCGRGCVCNFLFVRPDINKNEKTGLLKHHSYRGTD